MLSAAGCRGIALANYVPGYELTLGGVLRDLHVTVDRKGRFGYGVAEKIGRGDALHKKRGCKPYGRLTTPCSRLVELGRFELPTS